jgi:hypothetical protein
VVRVSLAELLEALGAVLVVAGLAFVAPAVALVAAGVFLLVVANAPEVARPVPSAKPGGHRRSP